MNAVRGLKLLSAVMAILIVGGLGLLGYGVYSKLGGSVKSDAESGVAMEAESKAETVAAAPPAGPVPVAEPVASGRPLASFGALGLDQPAGSRIAAVNTDGPLMTLRIEGGGQDDRVMIVDMRTGQLIGAVHVGTPGQ